MNKMPEVGSEIYLDQGGERGPKVQLNHCYGSARLYQAVDEEGAVGVIALQPDGSWWVVREFEQPEAWRQ